MISERFAGTLVLALLAGCGAGRDVSEAPLAPLPAPVANNAVAGFATDEAAFVFSFLGLGPGKTWRDTRSDAWLLTRRRIDGHDGYGPGVWRRLPDVPGPAGRLAAAAVTLNDAVYVFGGYTVSEDGSEKSVPGVHRINALTHQFHPVAPMPVPVDDTVALPYLDRYVYLVSGWHDTDNVSLVQVYDAVEDRWFEATPFPGPPVFGHAGGLAERTMIVCDGVKVEAGAGSRQFVASALCLRGDIDAGDPARIEWRKLDHHPGPALYRMAATGARGRVYFAGGSANPYNYDGIGYDGHASTASSSVFAYELSSDNWVQLPPLQGASMDHRGLVEHPDGFVLVGGMDANRSVLASTRLLTLD